MQSARSSSNGTPVSNTTTSASLSTVKSPQWRPTAGRGVQQNYFQDKNIKILYVCGDYEHDGPRVERSRLMRFSKRARRDLEDRSISVWEIKCQHYKQAEWFNEIIAWLKNLDNRDARDGFVKRKSHPAIDKNNEWLPKLQWPDLMLLDHSVVYMHLSQPLDNKKVRQRMWAKLDEFGSDPLCTDDLHIVYNLLQFKNKWLKDGTLPEDAKKDTTFQAGHTRVDSVTSVKSNHSTSSSLNNELLDILKDYDNTNGALIRGMVRKVGKWLADMEDPLAAFNAYIDDLRKEASACEDHAEEENETLITALAKAFFFFQERRGRA